VKKYSILMYNFNNYEIMREPEEIDPECEYIYVTDNPDFAKQTKVWNIIIDKDLEGLSPFDKCYRVRFNLFKYVTTPVCIYVDGSIQIHKSLRKLYDDFMASGADLGLNIHPERNTVVSEYPFWLNYRKYPKIQYEKHLAMFKAAEYDLTYKGLYQGTMRICKNTPLNKQIDDFVFETLVKLGTDGVIERLDQTIYSFILNKFFTDEVKIFPFSQQVFQSAYMTWKIHRTNYTIAWNKGNDNDSYVFNKFVKLYRLV